MWRPPNLRRKAVPGLLPGLMGRLSPPHLCQERPGPAPEPPSRCRHVSWCSLSFPELQDPRTWNSERPAHPAIGTGCSWERRALGAPGKWQQGEVAPRLGARGCTSQARWGPDTGCESRERPLFPGTYGGRREHFRPGRRGSGRASLYCYISPSPGCSFLRRSWDRGLRATCPGRSL